MPNDELQDALNPGSEPDFRTAYVELCKSYHRLKDFRAHLLGFLPLASGAGIFVLLDEPVQTGAIHQIAIGIFGMAVTVGLYLYEWHGTKLVENLICIGRDLEEELLRNDPGKEGQFMGRPDKISASAIWAAGIIYGSVGLGWGYVAVVGLLQLLDTYN